MGGEYKGERKVLFSERKRERGRERERRRVHYTV